MKKLGERIRPPRGKRGSLYADFRDLGGRVEALKAHPTDTQATTDRELALEIASRRVDELTALREERRSFKGTKQTRWNQIEKKQLYAKFKLWRLSGHGGHKRGNVVITEREVGQIIFRVKNAAKFFGTLTPQQTKPAQIIAYRDHLRATLKGKNGKAKEGTVSNYMNSLSNFFAFLGAHDMVDPGYNPYRTLDTSEKPKVGDVNDDFFEHHHAAAMLECARRMERTYSTRPGYYADQTYPLVATFMLTGGRLTEIRGLQWNDIDFRREVVYLIKNEHRDLKSRKPRQVPLWSQLRDILLEYREGCDPDQPLVFPPNVETFDGMRSVKSINDALDDIAVAMDWPTRWDLAPFEPPKIRSHRLRHTYTAVRLQTTEQGIPVSQFTVQEELGHSDWETTRKIYARLGRNVRRFEEVRYFMVDFKDEKWLEEKAKEFLPVRAA